MNEIKVEFNRDAEKAIDEIEKEITTAAGETVIFCIKDHLQRLAASLPIRSGNLRSSVLNVWRYLRIPGRPQTPVDTGEKKITYLDKKEETTSGRRKRWRTNKFLSNSVWRDNTANNDKPSFEYALYAAEWRKNRDSRGGDGDFVSAAMGSGLLSGAEIAQVRKMFESGSSYAEVANRVLELLSGVPGSASLIGAGGSGKWKPYHSFFKGNRKKITFRMAKKWEEEQQKIFDKHNGDDK